jgi:hypothetical protein
LETLRTRQERRRPWTAAPVATILVLTTITAPSGGLVSLLLLSPPKGLVDLDSGPLHNIDNLPLLNFAARFPIGIGEGALPLEEVGETATAVNITSCRLTRARSISPSAPWLARFLTWCLTMVAPVAETPDSDAEGTTRHNTLHLSQGHFPLLSFFVV